MNVGSDERLTEAWLRSAGFKWHEMERQGAKHWVLWLGDVVRGDGSMTDVHDLGIEVANGAYDGPGRDHVWFCWLRADYAGRYSRFLHVRHIRTQRDLVIMIQGLTGVEFVAEDCRFGCMRTPEQAERDRVREAEIARRLDQRMLREAPPWHPSERDGDRGRPLDDHLNQAIDKGGAS